MTRTLIAAAFVLLSSAAMAEYSLPAMPKKFQGTWVDVEDRSSMAVGLNTVSFGEPLRVISIVPCDEGGNCVNIKWQAGLSKTDVYFRLIKIDGRQAMISVNAKSPSVSNLHWKK